MGKQLQHCNAARNCVCQLQYSRWDYPPSDYQQGAKVPDPIAPLKTRLKKVGNELTTRCSQLKMTAADGKRYAMGKIA